MGRYRASVFGTSQDEEEDSPCAIRNGSFRSSSSRSILGHVIDSSSAYDDVSFRNNSGTDTMYWIQSPRVPDYFDSPPHNKRSRTKFWVVFVVVIAWLLAQYGPPAPPPQSDGAPQNWTDFMLTEMGRVFSSATSVGYTLIYVMSWCLVGVREDVKGVGYSFRQWHLDWKEKHRAVCPLVIPSLSESIEEWLSQRVVGQRRAVVTVAAALDAWDTLPDEEIVGHRTERHPLLLLLSGTTGVGKMETARQVAHLVFQSCNSNGIVHRGAGSPLSEGGFLLRGEDFSNHDEARGDNVDYSSDTATDPLEAIISRIGHHVKRQNDAGGVVVIHHVEKMAPLVFKKLCRLLSAPGARLSFLLESDDYGKGGGLGDHASVNLDNVVFIFTTSIGARSITQSIKKFGSIQHSPFLDLRLSIEHEIDSHFGEGNGDFGSLFHAVAPFSPLGHSALESILKHKVENLSLQRNGQRLLLTENASKALVDAEHVEYIELRKRDSETALLVFAATGAKVLETGKPIMNRLRSQMKRCLPELEPDRYAVLDFDDTAKEGLLCLCDHEASSCVHNACHGDCRFYL